MVSNVKGVFCGPSRAAIVHLKELVLARLQEKRIRFEGLHEGSGQAVALGAEGRRRNQHEAETPGRTVPRPVAVYRDAFSVSHWIAW
jgi:hypothetical protein